MKTQSIKIIRGDDNTVTIRLFGDYSSDTAYFTIKEDRVLTSDRITDLSTSNGIVSSYSNNYTTFVITVPKEDTQSLTTKILVWDLNIDSVDTPIQGDVNFIWDVRTPYDGLPSPEDTVRYALVDTSGFTENDVLVFDGTNLVNTSLHALQDLMDGGFIEGITDIFNLEEK